MSRLTILNYHNVAAPPVGAALPKLYVTPAVFERQCWVLQQLGLRGVTLTEGLQALQDGDARRCVAMTFDDGYADNLGNAAPILSKFGFRATCYVVSGQIGNYNAWDAEQLRVKKPLMNGGELGAWLAEGNEIGSHTLTHPHLDWIGCDVARDEIYASKTQLEKITGAPVQHFCYPYGGFTPEVVELVRSAGYRSAVTVSRGLATATADPFRLPRVSINGGKGLLRFALKAATPYAALKQRSAA